MQALTLATKILTAAIDPNGVWRVSICIGLSIAVFFLLKKVPISRLAKALWGYILIYSLILMEYPYPFYGGLSRSFEASAGQTFAEAVLIPLAVLVYPKQILKCIPYVVGLEIFLLWLMNKGLMMAPSFDTAFIALCLPLVSPWLWVPAFITIITRHGSTALTIIAAQVFSYLLLKRKFKHIIAGSMSMEALIWIKSDFLLGFHDRFEAWTRFMKFWAETPNRIAFGHGPGSFMWSSLVIDGFKAPVFLAMHSDWLQITFDLGLIGLILCLAFTLETAWKRRNLASLLGAVTFGMTYHPLRFLPSAVVTALIFRLASVEQEVDFKLTSTS